MPWPYTLLKVGIALACSLLVGLGPQFLFVYLSGAEEARSDAYWCP